LHLTEDETAEEMRFNKLQRRSLCILLFFRFFFGFLDEKKINFTKIKDKIIEIEGKKRKSDFKN